MTVDLDSYAEGAILLDGFEEAIIGIAQEFGNGRRIVYSRHKIIQILCEKHLMTEGEAEEYFDFNVLGLHAGEQNAIFMELGLKPEKVTNGWKYILE